MECVDDEFLKVYMDIIFDNLQFNQFFKTHCDDLALLKEKCLAAYLDHKNIVFVHIPNVGGDAWPEHIQRTWNRDWKKKMGPYSRAITDNYVYFELTGMTFSGDTLHTTLGNTKKTTAYSFLYQRRCGI